MYVYIAKAGKKKIRRRFEEDPVQLRTDILRNGYLIGIGKTGHRISFVTKKKVLPTPARLKAHKKSRGKNPQTGLYVTSILLISLYHLKGSSFNFMYYGTSRKDSQQENRSERFTERTCAVKEKKPPDFI